MTRVAFVAPSLNGGGAERAAVTVLNGLDTSTFARGLYLFRREGPYLRDVGQGVDLVAASSDGRLARLRQLGDFLRVWRPDVVVSFLSYFSTYLAMRLAGSTAAFVINQQTPLSAFLTDRDYAWRKPVRRRAFEAVARRVYPRAGAVIATSRGVGDDLTANFGVAPERIAVIPNPFDLEAIAERAREPLGLTLPAGVPVIVSAGRLAEAKNWPLLIDALQLLKRDRPFHALILGQGELEAGIRGRVDANGLGADVTFCGFQGNPWKFMARGDVFVLTSHYEGFGNVLVEAMACGTPVVATVSPGTRAIVEPEANGLLVAHDAPSVAAALARVLGNSTLRRQLASGSRASAQKYAVAEVVAAYDCLFTSLVA